MKINPNDSATGFAFGNDQDGNIGLTIRAQIAAMCLQGLLAKTGYAFDNDFLANQAVEFADELIKQLNETS